MPVHNFGAQFGEGFDEALAIRMVPEDWLALVAAIHHGVESAGIFD